METPYKHPVEMKTPQKCPKNDYHGITALLTALSITVLPIQIMTFSPLSLNPLTLPTDIGLTIWI